MGSASAPPRPLDPPAAVHRAGALSLLLDYPDTSAVLAAAASLRASSPVGLVDLVPAERTLGITMATAADLAALRSRLHELPAVVAAPSTEREVVLDTVYDGEDLENVAHLLGCTPAAVVDAHTATRWQAAFGGFAPGFAYLVPHPTDRQPDRTAPAPGPTRDDDRAPGNPPWEIPRRDEPRTRVPAGAVALAAQYSAVYPAASPGGWQLIGRTGTSVWDAAAIPPALLSPGTTVRFRAVRPRAHIARVGDVARPESCGSSVPGARPACAVLDPGPLTLVEDRGRPGSAHLGVTGSGAADHGALRRANAAVGNPLGAPGLEVLLGPLVLRAETALVLACAGAGGTITVERVGHADGDTSAEDHAAGRAFAVDPGDVVRIGPAIRGLRRVLAVRGGILAPSVLGSCSRDTLSGLGPAPLRAGQVIHHGPVRGLDAVPVSSTELPPGETADAETPAPLHLEVIPGPRHGLLGAAALAALRRTVWTVRPDSDRIGIRLDGTALPIPADLTALPSEAAVRGAVQVPPSGLPVVFGPDHPVTGGYPVIAVVTEEGCDALAQAAPGTTVRLV